MSLKLQARSAETRRCAYCHDADGELSCPDCGTALHAACWIEVGTCPTLGCSHSPSLRSLHEPGRPVTVRHPLSRSMPALQISWLLPLLIPILGPRLHEMPLVGGVKGALFIASLVLLAIVVHRLTRPRLQLDADSISRTSALRIGPNAALRIGPGTHPRESVTAIHFSALNLAERATLTIIAGCSTIRLDSSADGFAEACQRVFEAVETTGTERFPGFRDMRLVRAYAALPEFGEAIPTRRPSRVWPLLLLPTGVWSLIAFLMFSEPPLLFLVALVFAFSFWLWLFYEALFRTEAGSVAISGDRLYTLEGQLALAELKEVRPRPATTGFSASVTFVGPELSQALRRSGSPRPDRRIVIRGDEDHLRRLLHLVREARRRLRAMNEPTETAVAIRPSAAAAPLNLRVTPKPNAPVHALAPMSE